MKFCNKNNNNASEHNKNVETIKMKCSNETKNKGNYIQPTTKSELKVCITECAHQ